MVTTREPDAARRETIVRPGQHDRDYLPDIWRHRELFYRLAWRDILVRYKQTELGALWAILKPLLSIAVLSWLFGRLAGLRSGDVPYPILVAAAMLPWQFFASVLTDCSNSLLYNSELVSRVYFPRLILPGSTLVVNLVDFLLACVILCALCLAYGFVPSPRVVLLPAYLLLAILAAAGLGLWFAALVVRYRDVRHLVPFLLQIGLFLSPVGFSSAIVPAEWRTLYALNPMVGVIEGFRSSILGGPAVLDAGQFALSAGVTLVLFVGGYFYFRRVERTFADVI